MSLTASFIMFSFLLLILKAKTLKILQKRENNNSKSKFWKPGVITLGYEIKRKPADKDFTFL